jgi:uncharacterized membrane protein YfcA
MYLAGILISLLIGVVLGLVGGGGSILTVPLVHYFFGESMFLATTYSLFVVTVASGIGVLQRIKQNEVDFKKGVIFVIPSMVIAFGIRAFIMPMFPISFSLVEWELSRDIVITILLVIVMFYVGFRTLFSLKTPSAKTTSVTVIILFGVLTGALCGFIGAGGGFIIVPILLRMGMNMKRAVGTSLFIIMVQSAVALMGDLSTKEIMEEGGINWPILLSITAATVVGVYFGSRFQKKMTGTILRKIFSVLILMVAIGLVLKMALN